MPVPRLGVAAITLIYALVQSYSIDSTASRAHLGSRKPLGQYECTVALNKHLDFLLESTNARMLNLLSEPGLVLASKILVNPVMIGMQLTSLLNFNTPTLIPLAFALARLTISVFFWATVAL